MTPAMPTLPHLRSWVVAPEAMRLAVLVTVAVFLADCASKVWVMELAANGNATIDPLVLLPTHNNAFVLSAGADRVDTQLVMLIRLAALYGLAFVFGRKVIADGRSAAGFGFILGGGVGNTADLAFDNAVLDFISVGPHRFSLAGEVFRVHFVFNAADVAILIGIALLAPRLQVWALAIQSRIAAWESTSIRLSR